jgi:hypothetical protein
MMSQAAINMSGVNFHGGSTDTYAVFKFAWNTSQSLEIRPLYYGMYFFAYASRSKSVFVPVGVASSDGLLLKSWALLDQVDHTLRVVVLYKVPIPTNVSNHYLLVIPF